MHVTEITRRSIVDYLLRRPEQFHGSLEMIDFVGRIWPLTSMPSKDSRFKDAHGDIWQHMINNQDFDEAYLLCDYLELLTCDDDTFFRFVELAVHPVVLPAKDRQREDVAAICELLADDDFTLQESGFISKRPVFKVASLPNLERPADTEIYEVVLSFAGEDREYVDQVASILRDHKVRLFYDGYEQATLWGKDLVEHLDKVYRGSARYCVMFISERYAAKLWPTHERRAALAKALESRTEYILPARFDDTDIPGILPTVGYVDLNKLNPADLSELILQKLGHTERDTSDRSAPDLRNAK